MRLDVATSPGSWLMPSRMVTNTESTIGYNNQLKQATSDMKLGVNNDINLGTKKASLQPMDGERRKANPPNPIHKQGEKKVRKRVLHRLLRRQKRPPLSKQQALKSNRIT